MRRYVPLLVAGSALVVAGCRDAIAPTRSETPETQIALVGDQSFSSIIGATDGAGALPITFEIGPGAGSARIGQFTLEYGANAVCDPETSGYGPNFFKKSCTPLGKSITITAKFWTEGGRHYTDFSPDIRFNPATDVTVSVSLPEIIGKRLKRHEMLKYGIFYVRQIGNTRLFIDEAWGDPDLRTHFDTNNGVVWRKVRHFSGYVIRWGYCEENPDDPECFGAE